MPSAQSANRNRLAVAGRVTRAFLSEGYGVSVALICERADVSERTFYRYFASKPEAVRPVLEHGIDLVSASLHEHAKASAGEALVAAFEQSLWGERGDLTVRLVRLIQREPPLYAVWLSTIRDFEADLGEAIRPWLVRPVDAVEHAAIAAVLVAAMRISFERGSADAADPVAVFRVALAAISIPALRLGGDAHA